MTINADSIHCGVPSYSIRLGDTTLETKDIDFIHALQKYGGSAQDVSLGLQNFIQKAKAD